MKISKNLKLQNLIIHANEVQQKLQKAGKKSLADEVTQQINIAKEEKFILGVVGTAKRGKSTLINGILGRRDDKLAPIDKFPATNVTTIFTYNEKNDIKVLFESGQESQISDFEIKGYVCEEFNKSNNKKVKNLIVSMPFTNIADGVYIVDTPGANNALDAQHGEILFRFLPFANALVFLLSPDNPLVVEEQDILKAIRGNDVKKVFFALNKMDRLESGDLDENEISECLAHNRKILADVGFADAKIYQISAKSYFEKGTDAGTEMLIEDIKKLYDLDKGAIIAEKLQSTINRLIDTAVSELKADLATMNLSASDIEKAQSEIQKSVKALISSRISRETIFKQEWQGAFEEFEHNLNDIRKSLKNEYAEVINNAKALKINEIANVICSDVQTAYSQRLTPHLEKCEMRIIEAQKQLVGSVQESFSNLTIQQNAESQDKKFLIDSLGILSAAAPSLMTGALATAVPVLAGWAVATGITGIAGAALPTGIYGLGWLTSIGAAGASGVASVGATIATTALAVVMAPVVIGAFSLAAIRMWGRWKANVSKQKNELLLMSNDLIDEIYQKISEHNKQIKNSCDKVLLEFNNLLEKKLNEAEEKLESLKKNTPTPEQKQKLVSHIEVLSNLEIKIEEISKTPQSKLNF